jgi:hypothetical protein
MDLEGESGRRRRSILTIHESHRVTALWQRDPGGALMKPRNVGARRLAALAVLSFVSVGSGLAQQPSPAEIEAIRESCRSDFISHCLGVQPGGREALECLASHAPQLSPACGSAVSAVRPKADTTTAQTPEAPPPAAPPVPAATAAPAAPASQSPQEQLAAVSKVCTLSDFTAHCSFIQPNNPELVLCLKANATDLSPACKTVVTGLPAATPAAAASPAPGAAPSPVAVAPSPPASVAPPVAPPAPPVAVARPKKPTQKQIGAIRAACRSDFISHCSGVQPGGPEALQCLERSKAEVSSRCQTALAAIGGAAPAAPVGAPTQAAAPPSAPLESFPVRRLRLREELAILRVCFAEQRDLCGNVPPGGGRIIACLARNASRLSPACRDAMAVARN